MGLYKGIDFATYYQDHLHGNWQIIDEANAEYTTDGGKTWKKCVKLEKEPWVDERFPELKNHVTIVLWNGTYCHVPVGDIRPLPSNQEDQQP